MIEDDRDGFHGMEVGCCESRGLTLSPIGHSPDDRLADETPAEFLISDHPSLP